MKFSNIDILLYCCIVILYIVLWHLQHSGNVDNTVHDYKFMMTNLSVWKSREYKNIQSNTQRVKSPFNCVHNNINFCYSSEDHITHFHREWNLATLIYCCIVILYIVVWYLQHSSNVDNTVHDYKFIANLSVWKYKREHKNI